MPYLVYVLIATMGCNGFIKLTLSATFYEVVEENSVYPGQCWSKHTGNYHNPGEIWAVPGECLKLSCLNSSKKLLVQYMSCSKIVPKMPCKMTSGESSGNFPKCCPRITCPLENIKIQR